MSAFDRLHPVVQHHVVNTLGWRELRPLQDLSIEPVLDGMHCLLLAPTAGGKTEAAFLPLLSRMVAEDWRGLSVIYVCPIKALLNNLHDRLQRYCQWTGRTCALWHGDVLQAQKKAVLKDQPDCLLTTPESLEAMLVSTRVDHRAFFSQVRAIVVDEVHAFAGDDRGWHLLAVFERITRLSGREPQRIGLSATVGNPESLLDWLAGHCQGLRKVIRVSADVAEPEVTVDYVGSLENASTVIAGLHRGEKRLVFCDSRSRVEQLAGLLRGTDVEVYVSHSSMSADERRRAEHAFAQGTNCVIVATSTLELGIDVGDLDRVIQIDAPATVSSFLQRMGRTGRRSDTRRNCLFLATTVEALVQCAALVNLWRGGFVEPVLPPAWPIHLWAQQILALVIQERSLPAGEWSQWIGRLPAFAAIEELDRVNVIKHLHQAGFIHEDQGLWMIGREAESEYGFRNFSELVSVFTSPPMFDVWWGSQHIGAVEQTNFVCAPEKRETLSLGGRAWRVTGIQWARRRVDVEPQPGDARTRWTGGSRRLGFELCQQIYQVLIGDSVDDRLSSRARSALADERAANTWLRSNRSGLRIEAGQPIEWWTYAGLGVNLWIAGVAAATGIDTRSPDNCRVVILGGGDVVPRLKAAIECGADPKFELDHVTAKFADLLPEACLRRFVTERSRPRVGLDTITAGTQAWVSLRRLAK